MAVIKGLLCALAVSGAAAQLDPSSVLSLFESASPQNLLSTLASTAVKGNLFDGALNTLGQKLLGLGQAVKAQPAVYSTAPAAPTAVSGAPTAVSGVPVTNAYASPGVTPASQLIAQAPKPAALQGGEAVVTDFSALFKDIASAAQSQLQLPKLDLSQLLGAASQGSASGFSVPEIALGNGTYINPALLSLTQIDALFEDVVDEFCTPVYATGPQQNPETLAFAGMEITLETGACALTTDFTADPNDPTQKWLVNKGFVCKSPELSYSTTPATYTPAYTSGSQVVTRECKLAQNISDSWSKTLYDGGEDVVYASREQYLLVTTQASDNPVETLPEYLLNKLLAPIEAFIQKQPAYVIPKGNVTFLEAPAAAEPQAIPGQYAQQSPVPIMSSGPQQPQQQQQQYAPAQPQPAAAASSYSTAGRKLAGLKN